MRLMEWMGRHARWILFLGCFAAFFVPWIGAAMRPALPALVAMVITLGMLRIDLAGVARGLARPQRAAAILLGAASLLAGTSWAGWHIAQFFGLGEDVARMAVMASASAPIASAPTLCLLMGLNAALALEITVAMSLMMPVVGPAVIHWLVGAELDVSPLALGLRTAAMLGAGALVAILVRRWVGAQAIARNGVALDGIGAVAMIIFVIPVFDGVGALILERPRLALEMTALCIVLMWAPHALALAIRRFRPADAGAVAIVGGTRSVALYFAASPPDPVYSVFTALYQFPMLATPLALGPAWLRKIRGASPSDP